MSKPGAAQRVVHVRSFAPSKTGVAIGTPRVTLPAASTSCVLVHALDALVVDIVAIGDLHRLAHRGQIAGAAIFLQRLVDLDAQTARGPAHVRLEDLTDVHPRRHAQRVETEIDRRAIREERHVLHRHHLRDHALVAVTAGHLVARLQLALHRDEDLDHLHHARGQIVAAADLLDLVLEPRIQRALLRLVLLVQGLDDLRVVLVLQRQLPPLAAWSASPAALR